MRDQDKIIDFLKATGPTLPSKVAKNIGTDILLASAHLSDLVSQGKVRISFLKVGGSPLYYLSGQESQLYPFAAGNINSKDLQVLEQLKNEKVLQEANLDLLFKVALRSLKDFAIPLLVNVNSKRKLFWKWHLLAPEETEEIIAKILHDNESEATDSTYYGVTSDPTPSLAQEKIEVTSSRVKKEDPKKEISLEVQSNRQEMVVLLREGKEDYHSWKDKISSVEKEERQQKLKISNDQEKVKEVDSEKDSEWGLDSTLEKVEEVVEKRKGASEEVKERSGKSVEEGLAKRKDNKIEEKKNLVTRTRQKKKLIPDTFLPNILAFFNKLEIRLEKQETVRKNSEINFLVDVPSVVGTLRYFCKAKQKNRCDEKDLSAAYVEAQMKKLPLLFLYSKQISKKAEQMLESDALENVVVKKIE